MVKVSLYGLEDLNLNHRVAHYMYFTFQLLNLKFSIPPQFMKQMLGDFMSGSKSSFAD